MSVVECTGLEVLEGLNYLDERLCVGTHVMVCVCPQLVGDGPLQAVGRGAARRHPFLL